MSIQIFRIETRAEIASTRINRVPGMNTLSGKKNKLINLQLLFPICFPGFRCNKSQYLLLVQTVPYSKLLFLVCLNGIGRTGYLPLLLISPPQTRT
ncbi:hypothetical protein GQ457_03G045620 [Hibiscus cannabinus]